MTSRLAVAFLLTDAALRASALTFSPAICDNLWSRPRPLCRSCARHTCSTLQAKRADSWMDDFEIVEEPLGDDSLLPPPAQRAEEGGRGQGSDERRNSAGAGRRRQAPGRDYGDRSSFSGPSPARAPKRRQPDEQQESDRAPRAARGSPDSDGRTTRPWRKPLPTGVDMALKSLSLEELESRMKSKFAAMREDQDAYDPDDEGYESSDGAGVASSAALDGASDAAATDRKTKRSAAAPAQTFRMRAKPTITVAAVDEDEAAERPEGVRKRGVTAAAAAANRAGGGSEDVDAEEEANGSPRSANAAAAAAAAAKPAKAPAPQVEYLHALTLASIEAAPSQSTRSFAELGVPPGALADNLAAMGIFEPTPVQAASITALLENGADAVIHAHTGSGKTLAYLLPMLAKLNPEVDSVQAVVVAPGRELAAQIESVCDALLEGTGLRSLKLFGGTNISRQLEKLKKDSPQILVGTPGRIAELALERKRLRLSGVQVVVLDEVDALLRPPHDEAIAAIFAELSFSERRQTIFASATGLAPAVRDAAAKYMRENHEFVDGASVSEGGAPADGAQALPSSLRHAVLTAPRVKKLETLRRLMNTQPFPECVMIFVNDPQQVTWLTDKLGEGNIIAAPLSGLSSKEDRTDIVRRLRDGRLGAVVTTEMAARGLDVPTLTHVVNYDLPTDAEHYVHRAGRAGRAGRPGIVVSIATPDTKFVVAKFSRQLKLPVVDAELRAAQLWAVKRTMPAPADGASSQSEEPRTGGKGVLRREPRKLRFSSSAGDRRTGGSDGRRADASAPRRSPPTGKSSGTGRMGRAKR